MTKSESDAWLITDLGIVARDRDGWQLIPLPSDVVDMGGPGVHWATPRVFTGLPEGNRG
jgi:hypothetical protein